MLEKTLTIQGVKITPFKTHVMINTRIYYFNEYFQLQDLKTDVLSLFNEDDINFYFDNNKIDYCDITHETILTFSKLKKVYSFDRIIVAHNKTYFIKENKTQNYYSLIKNSECAIEIDNSILNSELEIIPNHWVKYL